MGLCNVVGWFYVCVGMVVWIGFDWLGREMKLDWMCILEFVLVCMWFDFEM